MTVRARKQPIFLFVILTLMTVAMLTAVPVFAGKNTGNAGDFASVTVTPMQNGYCALSFSVPGTTKEVFVTGIREDKAKEIYFKFLAAWKDGEEFEITDESVIDAEKTPDSDDEDMSFAAAGCNMLVYTGWAAQLDPALGIASEDDAFEEIIPEFTNTPDNSYFTGLTTSGFLEWFFSGTLGSDEGAELMFQQSVRYYPGSGGYLADYDVSSLLESGGFPARAYTQKMKTILEALMDGAAVELGNSTQSVTCFGMVTDARYSDTDDAHYCAAIISDSDSDQSVTGTDRRTLPNKLNVTPIANRELYESMLSEYTLLKPYDGIAGIESNPEATKNRRQDPDLRIQGINAAVDPGPALLSGSVISEGEDCKLNIAVQAYDDSGFTGQVTVRAAIYRDDTEMAAAKTSGADSMPEYRGDAEIAASEMTDMVSLSKYQNRTFSLDFSSENLPAGNYLAVAEISADETAVEAFLCNNAAELSFTVADDGGRDLSGSTIELEIDNNITEDTALAYIVYHEADMDFLRNNEGADIAFALYDEGEEPVFSSLAENRFDDDGLPLYTRFDKEKEFIRACVSVISGGKVYYLYSPEYRVPYARLSVTLDADTTEEFSPVSYRSTHFNGEEKITFSIKNTSVAFDEVYAGEYFLTDNRFTGAPLTDNVSFTVGPDETKGGFTITELNTPLTRDTTIYLAWKMTGENYVFTDSVTVGTIKVLPAEYYIVSFEPGEGVGGMEDVHTDTDGKFNLPGCMFTVPDGKIFYNWKDTKTDRHAAAGESCIAGSDMTFRALYRDRLVAGHAVDVDEDAVRIRFFLNLADEAVADGVSVRFRWTDKEDTVPVSGDNYVAERGAYMAVCPLDWADRNETVTAEVYRNGKMIAVRTYSIAKYYDNILQNFDEYELNEYDGADDLNNIYRTYPPLLDGSGFEDTDGARSYSFLPSCYDSKDEGAVDIPYPDESQSEFEESVHSEGYTGIYDGKAHGITVTIPEGAEVRFGTEKGKYDLTENPTFVNAGTCRVYYEVSKAGLIPVNGSETVEIKKADQTITAPMAKNLTYTGSSQELITAGKAEAGDMLYALGKDAETVPKDKLFSKTIPSLISAGKYYVWYKAAGDENHNEILPEAVPVTIARKDISGAEATLNTSEITYDGKEHFVSVVSVKLKGETLPSDAYKLTGGFSGTDVGTYVVTIEGAGNYTGKITATWKITPGPTGKPVDTVTPTPTAVPTNTVTPKPTSKPVQITPRPAKSPVTSAAPSPSDAASDSKSASSGKSGSGKDVSTGDDTHFGLWIFMMALSGIILVLTSGRKKSS